MNERGKPLKFQKSAMGATSIPVYSADPKVLIELALAGNVETMDKFLMRHSDVINVKEDQFGNVALHVVSSRDNVPLIELLIRRGANLTIQDIYGNTALHYAVDKERTNAMDVLIRRGAQVNVPDFRGNSPLHSACATGNIDSVRLLLKNGADPDALDYSNCKPGDKTNKYEIHQAIEWELEKRRGGDDPNQKIINFMGFGIGLGVGLGIALAKQQQQFAEQQRIVDDKKKAEDERERERKREEINAMLGGPKATKGGRMYLG